MSTESIRRRRLWRRRSDHQPVNRPSDVTWDTERYRHKHSSEPKKDLLKAQWYLNKLLKEW
jgi:hypothetical protein